MAGPRLPADALAQLKTPPKEALSQFDVPRDAFLDDAFARGMATGDEMPAATSRICIEGWPGQGQLKGQSRVWDFPPEDFGGEPHTNPLYPNLFHRAPESWKSLNP
jgi:hypothetical protein